MTRITDNFHEGICSFMLISLSLLRRMRNVSDESCIENQNTHLVFNKFLPRKSCFLGDNTEKFGTAGQAVILDRKLNFIPSALTSTDQVMRIFH